MSLLMDALKKADRAKENQQNLIPLPEISSKDATNDFISDAELSVVLIDDPVPSNDHRSDLKSIEEITLSEGIDKGGETRWTQEEISSAFLSTELDPFSLETPTKETPLEEVQTQENDLSVNELDISTDLLKYKNHSPEPIKEWSETEKTAAESTELDSDDIFLLQEKVKVEATRADDSKPETLLADANEQGADPFPASYDEKPEPTAAQRVFAAGQTQPEKSHASLYLLLGLLLAGGGMGYYFFSGLWNTGSQPLNLRRHLPLTQVTTDSPNTATPMEKATPLPSQNRSSSLPPSEPNPSTDAPANSTAVDPVKQNEVPPAPEIEIPQSEKSEKVEAAIHKKVVIQEKSVGQQNLKGEPKPAVAQAKKHANFNDNKPTSLIVADSASRSPETNSKSQAEAPTTIPQSLIDKTKAIVKSIADDLPASATQTNVPKPPTLPQSPQPPRSPTAAQLNTPNPPKINAKDPSTALPKEANPNSAPAVTTVDSSSQSDIQVLKKMVVPSVNTKLSQAYSAFQRGDAQTATTAYRATLEQDPNNRDALFGLAALAMRRGRVQEARQHYQQILKFYPQDTLAQVGLVNTFGGMADTEMESRLKFLLQQMPTSAYIHFSLGSIYARQSQWTLAQQAYFEAYRYDNTRADYVYNLAISLDHLNQPRSAISYYQQALQLARNQPIQFSLQAVQRRLQTLQAKTGTTLAVPLAIERSAILPNQRSSKTP